jgi:hypothetical protein
MAQAGLDRFVNLEPCLLLRRRRSDGAESLR